MEQERSARERIMAAFIAMLEEPHLSAKGLALIPQLAKYIDGHFSRYCSFYDRKKLLKKPDSGTKYYLSFLTRPSDIERVSVSELTKAAVVLRGRPPFFSIKYLRRHLRAELESPDEGLFFKHREQFVPVFAAECGPFYCYSAGAFLLPKLDKHTAMYYNTFEN